MRRYSGRKRKGYPSRYDRVQDAKIRKLQKNIVLKQFPNTLVSKSLTGGTGQLHALCLIPQGETDSTREGATAHLQSISLRWQAQGSAVATTATGTLRIIIGIDHDPEGSLPTMLNFLHTEGVLSQYNTGLTIGQEKSRGRFKILYDVTRDMRSDGAIASADHLAGTIHGKFYKKLNGLRILYTGDAGAITEIEQENLFLAVISLNNSEVITFSFQWMVRFTAPD